MWCGILLPFWTASFVGGIRFVGVEAIHTQSWQFTWEKSTSTNDGTVNKSKAKENDEMFSAYLPGLAYLFKSIQPASDVFPITFPLFNFISHPVCCCVFCAWYALCILYVIEFLLHSEYSCVIHGFDWIFFASHFEMRHRSTAHQLLAMYVRMCECVCVYVFPMNSYFSVSIHSFDLLAKWH